MAASPARPDWPLARVVEQLVATGRSSLPVEDPPGQPLGVFDFLDFLRQASAGRAWTPLDPVGAHLCEGAPASGRDATPSFLGMALLHRAATSAQPLLVGIVDGAGTLLYANAELQQAFRASFRQPQTRISDLFPDLGALPFAEPSGAATSLLVSGQRTFSAFFVPLLDTGVRGFTLVAAHELTRQLPEAHARALHEVDLLERVLDISVDGLMVVDTEGIITRINRSFEEIHGVKRADVLGRHVTDIIDNTRMHIVAQTGVAEVDDFQEIGEKDFVVTRFPIFKDGRCVGAVGKIIFKDFKEINRLASKVLKLQGQLDALRKRKAAARSDTRYTFTDIVAHAEASRAARQRAMRVAPTHATVLLLGESGVGKEVYAHAIHNLSPRSHHAFVRVNCSAILETLFESELFGYADGAFTGARKGGKQGKFELADSGTIFLDEIGDMPLPVQAKLLRVLQEREIDRVGGEEVLPVDVRIIAATNQDLAKLVDEGRFRKDLYYRLNVVPILIPPLRDRLEDLPDLIQAFWTEMQSQHGIYHKRLSPDARALLQNYSWPGNIRELRNVLERALAVVLEDTISEDQIRMILAGLGSGTCAASEASDCTLAAIVAASEKRAISFALARANNNRVQAAKLLGISRPLLYKKLHEYGLG